MKKSIMLLIGFLSIGVAYGFTSNDDLDLLEAENLINNGENTFLDVDQSTLKKNNLHNLSHINDEFIDLELATENKLEVGEPHSLEFDAKYKMEVLEPHSLESHSSDKKKENNSLSVETPSKSLENKLEKTAKQLNETKTGNNTVVFSEEPIRVETTNNPAKRKIKNKKLKTPKKSQSIAKINSREDNLKKNNLKNFSLDSSQLMKSINSQDVISGSSPLFP